MCSIFKDNLKINKINLRGYWSWNIHNETCPICRCHLFEAPCNGNIINPVVGVCNHAFHYECISSWLKNQNKNCPLCNQTWVSKKNENVESTESSEDNVDLFLDNFPPLPNENIQTNEDTTIMTDSESDTDDEMPALVDDVPVLVNDNIDTDDEINDNTTTINIDSDDIPSVIGTSNININLLNVVNNILNNTTN